jgi:hypothetical protein
LIDKNGSTSNGGDSLEEESDSDDYSSSEEQSLQISDLNPTKGKLDNSQKFQIGKFSHRSLRLVDVRSETEYKTF